MLTERERELYHKDKAELISKIITKEKQVKILEKCLFSKMKDCLYQFIDFFVEDELERLDMRIVADRFVKEAKAWEDTND